MIQRSKSWWWVAAFCSLSLFVYFQSIREKKGAISALKSKLEALHREKKEALLLKEELSLAVASQEDPAWIEMVLMRDLGVVPERWLKVHFKK
jgi:hypothetical protein